ncbi:MAG: TlyA family RNA methyltransferase [Lachnospiraceae bacterium]|nr:TlyA family RNA methyltransferase [Lachnospiraceae bacterium]
MKERLDVILVQEGYAPSREKAKAIIMSGVVYVNGQKEDKAGSFFDTSKVKVEVRGSSPKYVSRGGLKLEKAMEIWGFELGGKVCMDIGASTGGFTDCMLQKGADKVYSVDVGHGQLDWKLRNDGRVVVMEQTNFRFMKPEDIEDTLDFASVDVSFISLTKILIPARNLLKPGGEMVCLIKPQFEAGKDKVGKNGVVREAKTHKEVVSKIVTFADMIGFEVRNIDFSPIKGPEGNIEYLMYIRKREDINGDILALSEREAEERLAEVIAGGQGPALDGEFKEKIEELVSESHEIL